MCLSFFLSGIRDRTLRYDVKWDNHDLWNITQNDFEIKLLRKVRAQPAVVLLAWRKDKVCSDMKFIKEVHNAEAIPSPARGKESYCVLSRL